MLGKKLWSLGVLIMIVCVSLITIFMGLEAWVSYVWLSATIVFSLVWAWYWMPKSKTI